MGPPSPYQYPFFAAPEDDEINLLDLLHILRKRWKTVFLITLLGTTAAVAYALLATPIYRAQAVIAPPAEAQTGGLSAAIGAFGGLGAEIAGSMGISLGGTDANRLEALLKSHRITKRVVDKYNLLPIFFADDWDAKKESWNINDLDDIPTVWDAEETLENVYTVNNDTKAGILTITFEWEDTVIALEILQHFLYELALVMQEDELDKIEINRSFATEQLEKATDPVVVTKLQTLLSDQVEKAMMAKNVEHFAYVLIDPPSVSDIKVKPKRIRVASLGFIASGLAGIFLVFFLEWLDRTRLAPETTSVADRSEA